MLPRASREHYAAQARLTRDTAGALLQLWNGVDVDDLDGSFPLDALLAAVSSRQLEGAAMAEAYLAAVLAETDQDAAAVAAIRAAGFVGGSDGRPLELAMEKPIIAVKEAIARGLTTDEAMDVGRSSLLRIGATQVQDAGRDAVGVGIAARPAVSGYTRVVSLPACSRCVVLAGAWYEWNTGFQRHPGCDCRHVPASRGMAHELTTDARRAIDSGRVLGLSHAELDAIGEGADVGQVVNARSGMSVAGDRRFTTSGTTTRGSFGRSMVAAGTRLEAPADGGRRVRRATTLRLTPAQCYVEAKGSRDEAVRLLRRFGYLS